MAKNATKQTNPALVQDVNELKSRMEWLDEERRKSNRRLVEMDQRITVQERTLKERQARIEQLESQLTKTNQELSRVSQLDRQLEQFKEELVQLIDQYDQRRLESSEELERRQRVEQQVIARELADIRKELPPIPRLQEEMGLRQAEEARLANLIGLVQTKITGLEGRIETWGNDLTYLEESRRFSQQSINEFQTSLLDINKRWDPIHNRLDILANNQAKSEIAITKLGDAEREVRRNVKEWTEQVQIGEHERNQRLQKWTENLAGFEKRLEQFSHEWLTFSDQYKAAKMAVQMLSELQRQLEQQQRESSELIRVESNRMQTRWDAFVHENDKLWRTFEVDNEQHWAAANRQHRQVLERFEQIDANISSLEEVRDTLWRVQTAQADAIKQIPRLWLEQVEKAIAQDPNRRRQPGLVPNRGDQE